MLYVVRGMLRIEFADDISATRTLKEGDLLAIPPGTRCRAYRWPRESRERVIFLAITPDQAPGGRSAG